MRAGIVSMASTLCPRRSAPAMSSISVRVEFAATMVPSSLSTTRPHGARSHSSIQGAPLPRSRSAGAGVVMQVLLDEPDRLVRMTHVRTMAGRLHQAQRAPRHVPMYVLPNLVRGNEIIGALQNE